MVAVWRYCLLCAVFYCFIANAQPLRVAVATNFHPFAEQLAHTFTQQTGQPITIAAGASGALYAQILHGAPYDLFLSADSIRPQKLEQQGMTVAGSRYTYLVGQLAIWSTNDLPVDTSPLALKKWFTNGEPLVVANPKLAPYGIAAMQVLQHVGIDVAVTSVPLVTANNVMQAMQFIASGNATRGFVADHLIANRSQSVLIPPQFYAPIEQQMVILKRTQLPVIAAEFAQFVRANALSSLTSVPDGVDDGQP
ncbi:molybdate ABC transporter substrate-binding protein [Alteromonas flava]|uniref:molybdate ABC transporter substrate-binding protein n=1 Tax=Alteromonas flava TaxID=2048003 RepID=UPI000C2833FB|nr:molybdate ABC transporter substrate-binding protein [Alteromonas flava]